MQFHCTEASVAMPLLSSWHLKFKERLDLRSAFRLVKLKTGTLVLVYMNPISFILANIVGSDSSPIGDPLTNSSMSETITWLFLTWSVRGSRGIDGRDHSIIGLLSGVSFNGHASGFLGFCLSFQQVTRLPTDDKDAH